MKASKSPNYIKRALSSPQKRIHFSEFNSGKYAINNICVAYFLEEDTSIRDLSFAIDQAFISYPSLRIRLTQEGSTAQQYTVPFTPCRLDKYHHFHNIQESDYWFSSLVTEKVPYWDSPLAEFFPFQINDSRRGFVFRTHHIISDAWTYQLVTQEIYDVLNRPNPQKLIRKKKGSYWDFLKTDQNYNQSNRYDYDKKYWQEKLFPLPAKTGLFTEKHPRSPVAQRHQFILSYPQSKSIISFCDKFSISYSSFFLWVLSVLVSLRTGSDDFLLGMLTHNRIGKSEKKIAGMFVSTIALKFSLNNTESLWENLQTMLGLIASSMRHQRFPISGVESEDSEKRESVFNRLEIVYSYNSVEYPFDCKFLFCGAENFPLVVRPCMITGQKFQIEMDFRDDSIDMNQIQSLSEQYITVLEAVLDNKDQVLKTTPWVNKKNVERVLNKFNNPILPLEQPQLIHQFLEKQVPANHEKKAITFEDEFLSYKSLNEKANKVAHRLYKELGEGEQLIALLMDRSLDLMILLYAILKAGYAYVPLSKDHPVKRNRTILEAAGIKKLFTDNKALLESYDECFLFSDWDCSSESEENLDLQIEPERLAYIIYTSGSTGTPKGVMLEHGAVSNRLHWMKDYYRLHNRDCFVQKTPYTFDVSIPELFGWPQNGGRLHLLSPGEEKDPSAIIKKVEEHSITIIHFVPSMLGIFLDYIENRSTKVLFETIRIVVCSGEALDVDTIARFWRYFDKDRLKLYNLYGPTEAAVEVTFHECLPTQHSPVPIGKPITNVQLLVLSKEGQILPSRVQGELCIAGPCLARGYFNAPELTDKAFVAHPLDKEKKIYKTGDLASWTEDGDLLYQGRIDNQVKIRGNRIEIGEIEEALRSHKHIVDAVVLVQKDKAGQNALAGHYCARGNCDPESLRLYLADRIPPYMVPSLWKEHRSFTLTTSGKTDRKSIEPVPIRVAKKNVEKNISDIEASIIEEWKKVLPVEDFSWDDDFFNLGGDSFSLITIFGNLEEKYQLTLQELFDHSTINDLTEFILTTKNISLVPKNKGKQDWEPYHTIALGRKKLFDYHKTLNELKETTFSISKTFKNIFL
ncbi:MAG: amino acid adenylation domain-containing protein, partial [Spirochaetaceae bacterium]|nr:amino acid adenylation domain-containing protein [Spirochaetaceae bacterium]